MPWLHPEVAGEFIVLQLHMVGRREETKVQRCQNQPASLRSALLRSLLSCGVARSEKTLFRRTPSSTGYRHTRLRTPLRLCNVCALVLSKRLLRDRHRRYLGPARQTVQEAVGKGDVVYGQGKEPEQSSIVLERCWGVAYKQSRDEDRLSTGVEHRQG